MDQPRFAIYFVPPADSTLYRFGAGFLGYDCYTGKDLGPPDSIALGLSDWTAFTAAPRAYGFHATLKAPFHLTPTSTEGELAAELNRFAAVPRMIPTLEPIVRALGRFVAIVPGTASSAVDRLAADCVTTFDRFRRPLAVEERRKRLGTGLSRRHIEHLERWGYPFVFEDFRFHMTLTGPIDEDRRAGIVALLQDRFAAACRGVPLAVTRLALLRQEGPSTLFRVVCHAELTAAPV
jgi:Protein of unknown function (DUF1045)